MVIITFIYLIEIHVEFLDLKAFLEGPNGVYKVRHDKGLSRVSMRIA